MAIAMRFNATFRIESMKCKLHGEGVFTNIKVVGHLCLCKFYECNKHGRTYYFQNGITYEEIKCSETENLFIIYHQVMLIALNFLILTQSISIHHHSWNVL